MSLLSLSFEEDEWDYLLFVSQANMHVRGIEVVRVETAYKWREAFKIKAMENMGSEVAWDVE